jgi:hypothetical protein
VPLHDRADDRQAEAAAGRGRERRPGRVRFVEAIEDVRQVLGGNAGPLSRTVICTRESSARARNSMRPPSGVCLMAFDAMF